MSFLGKRAFTLLLALLLTGVAVHWGIKGRIEAGIAAGESGRRRQLAELRAENRRLLAQARAADRPEAPAPAVEIPAAVRRMNAATELLQTGFFGPFAWTRGPSNSVADEVAELADVLGLTADQKSALLAAAGKAEAEIVAAVLASARVRLNENTERGPAETREESAERMRLMQDATPLAQMTISARMLSKQAASRGEREVSIEIPELPQARAAFDEMQASFARIMGPDTYAFYQTAGAARTIESMFDEIGLQPHWLSLLSRPSGTTSALEERMAATRAKAQEAAIAAGRRPPPNMPVSSLPPSPQGTVYEFHRIRSMVTMPEPVLRSPGGRGLGGGGGSALSGIASSGVSYGSSLAITGEALRASLGPLLPLLPPGF